MISERLTSALHGHPSWISWSRHQCSVLIYMVAKVRTTDVAPSQSGYGRSCRIRQVSYQGICTHHYRESRLLPFFVFAPERRVARHNRVLGQYCENCQLFHFYCFVFWLLTSVSSFLRFAMQDIQQVNCSRAALDGFFREHL